MAQGPCFTFSPGGLLSHLAPNPKLLSAALGVFFHAIASGQTVTLPRPDSSGWIKLFRGSNTGDFYAFSATGYSVPSQNKQAFPGGSFSIQGGDTIRTSGSPNAQLIFRQPFSHYRMQVQVRWPGSLGNTGVMTKLQENDTAQGNALPRAIEFQGDPGQGMGQIWALGSIGGVGGGTWITVRARMITHPQRGGTVKAAQVDSTASEIDYGGVGPNNDNLIVGYPGWQQPRPAALNNNGWITFEVESHGRDTTRHFVDGQKVMEYRNPRIAPRNNANQVIKYLTEGLLSLQSEGREVWYRNFRIMLLPEDPLYASVYTPTHLRGRIAPRRPAAQSLLIRSAGEMVLFSKEGFPVSASGRRFPNLTISGP